MQVLCDPFKTNQYMLLYNTSVAVQKGTLYWSVYDSDLHECSKFIIIGGGVWNTYDDNTNNSSIIIAVTPHK